MLHLQNIKKNKARGNKTSQTKPMKHASQYMYTIQLHSY